MILTEYTLDGDAFPVGIKKSIPLVEEGAVVDLVVSTIINRDGEIWAYSPSFFTYALNANLLQFFTDYDVAAHSVDETYRVINESDVLMQMEDVISPIQLASI